MSADLALDPVKHKLIFPLRLIRGPEKVAQSVRIHLRTWIGQWFLDLEHGVPYIGGVLGKQRPEMVEQILRAHVLGVEGVRRLDRFSLEIDTPTRRARVEFQAQVEGGQVEGVVALALRTFGNV